MRKRLLENEEQKVREILFPIFWFLNVIREGHCQDVYLL